MSDPSKMPHAELYAAYRAAVQAHKDARAERRSLGEELRRRYAERDRRLEKHLGRAAAIAVPTEQRFAVLAKLENWDGSDA